jgi:hypothetical protein
LKDDADTRRTRSEEDIADLGLERHSFFAIGRFERVSMSRDADGETRASRADEVMPLPSREMTTERPPGAL